MEEEIKKLVHKAIENFGRIQEKQLEAFRRELQEIVKQKKEPEKREEVFVWGLSFVDGDFILAEEPIRGQDMGRTQALKSSVRNIFPSDFAKKYRLVPADDPSTPIPWQEFDPEKMQDISGTICIVTKSGTWHFVNWPQKYESLPSELIGMSFNAVKHYCHIHELPHPSQIYLPESKCQDS